MAELIEKFGESTIHIIEVDGEKLIKASDCAKALDYKNYRVAVNSFLESNYDLLNGCVRKIRTQSRHDRQMREQWYFNEKGLIAFLIKTNQPKAIEFQKWAINILAREVKKAVEEKEIRYGMIRAKSKKVRVEFTEILRDHGYKKPHEYIQTTYFMKTKLGIDKHRPKNELSPWELCKVTMAEILSITRLADSEADGYHDCKPLIGEASDQVSMIPEKSNIDKLT